jgi:hypothetical protein
MKSEEKLVTLDECIQRLVEAGKTLRPDQRLAFEEVMRIVRKPVGRLGKK